MRDLDKPDLDFDFELKLGLLRRVRPEEAPAIDAAASGASCRLNAMALELWINVCRLSSRGVRVTELYPRLRLFHYTPFLRDGDGGYKIRELWQRTWRRTYARWTEAKRVVNDLGCACLVRIT